MSDPPVIFEAGADVLGSVLAEASDDVVCLAGAHGELLYMNLAGRRLLGIGEGAPAASLVLRDLYVEESWKELRDVAVPEVKKNGRWEGRVRLRRVQTGEELDVVVKMYRLRPADAGAAWLVFYHRPIDRQAELQAALDEAQARKRAILESSLDPIITINHEGVITEFNRAAEQTFGHAREKILGTRPSDVLFPPTVYAGQRDRIDRYLNAGEGSLLGRRVEATAVRANGEPFDAEMAMTISHERGDPVLTFFIRDISRRKKAEQQQARYAAELERSNRELEQFAYAASHDLQEPLRKILAFGNRLRSQCCDQLGEAGNDCLDRIQNAAARMQSLIEGLLSLSRVTTLGQRFTSVDLAQTARDVLSDLEMQIERAEGRVEIGQMPVIQADPVQMRQLLQNLLANALKFHRPQTPPIIRVEGRFLHGRLDRSRGAAAAKEQCRITVEDNGIGFDEKYKERIFGVFQRLHPREVFEGLGLGLALCRKIVERHGGAITAHGAPGRGSVFEIVLPVTQS
jgi:two-component system, LuxR family, sensor kinase FixL